VHAVAGMRKFAKPMFGRFGFSLIAIRGKKKLRLKLLRDELAALTLENQELRSQMALALEEIDDLKVNVKAYRERYETKKSHIQELKDKRHETRRQHKHIQALWDLFKESQKDLRWLESYIRREVAKDDILMTLPMCVDPISRLIVEDPMNLPCNCNCVYGRAMLMKLKPPECPTCHAKFLHEQVKPNHVLRDVINQLVEVSMMGNRIHSLETLVSPLISPPDAAPMHSKPALAGGC
jgi:hypothetical protein